VIAPSRSCRPKPPYEVYGKLISGRGAIPGRLFPEMTKANAVLIALKKTREACTFGLFDTDWHSVLVCCSSQKDRFRCYY